MSKISKQIELGGKTLTLETGVLAEQANAAVLARYGDTMVLATVVSAEPPEGIDYFPLSVDYVEKWYAGGRISSSRFIKRENRPSETAILTGRLIDRSVRPLFPHDFFNAVQIIITVLSVDQENDPDILSLAAASAALSVSDIPWKGPIGALRIGKLKDSSEFVVNPTYTQMDESPMDLVVSYTKSGFLMVEMGAKEVAEDEVVKAVKFGQEEVKPILKLIEEFTKECGKKKMEYEVPEVDKDLVKEIEKYAEEKIKNALFSPGQTWHESTASELKDQMHKEFEEKVEPIEQDKIFDQVAKKIMKESILKNKKRIDGRKFNEVRPIEIEVGVLPRTHGSAMFQRGDTQDLSIVTLGSPSLEQLVEGMEGEGTKRFMHHYNFSTNPFCTGEVKRLGSPSRRDIGHGNLAERSLESVIPGEEEFPYTIRLVSEILAADASTSMAALCGSTMALLDAGVPLKSPVAGVAMGLLADDKSYEILTDLRAVEDFFGDMDLKVGGTKNGITAIQMDIKLEKISLEIFEKGLKQAKEAREHILARMAEVLATPRPQISPFAPKISVIHIDTTKIGEVIGPGGKIIRAIIAQTGATVDVEDDGTVTITGQDDESVTKAMKWVEGITHEVAAGEVYEGEVKRMLPFGAFVEILPGKDGMVHVSEMGAGYVAKPEDVVKIGDKVKVRVIKIDDLGRVNLSMKFGEAATNEDGNRFQGEDRSRGRGDFKPNFRRDRRR